MSTDKQNKYLTDTYFLDLGDSVSFMSIVDVQRLGADSTKWPKVHKEKDPRKQGGLANTRPTVPNRVMAAKAYAYMLNVGESKACLAAGRWLCTETQTSSFEYEKAIRRKLSMVDNTEEIMDRVSDRPLFCSPECKRPSDQEVKEWSFGVRSGTAAVLGKVGKACEDDDSGWVPIGTGSRCLGETSGDFDVVIYNKKGVDDTDSIIRALSALSSTGRTNLHSVAGETLLQIADLRIGEASVEVDCLITKEGERAHARVAQQGLFLEKVIVTSGYKYIFQEAKALARACGIIDPTGGYLNSYTVVLTLFEFMVISRNITIDKTKPLFSQDPICMPAIGLDLVEVVREYFEWLRDKMDTPDYVFVSFGDATCASRSASEFKSSSYARVCRDPFSYKIENTMRTVQGSRIKNILLYIQHAAYCRMSKRHIIDTADFMQRATNVGYQIESVITASGADVPLTLSLFSKHKSLYVFVGHPRMSFGLGADESDARGRCAVNHLREFKERVTLIWGPGLLRQFGYQGPTCQEILSHGTHWYCSATEDTIWSVGICSMDCNENEIMVPMDKRSMELVLQIVSLYPEETELFPVEPTRVHANGDY